MTHDARFERPFTCTDCGETIIVGGYFEDIDPATYRGVACGCRREQPRTRNPRADLAGTIERAREAQKATV